MTFALQTDVLGGKVEHFPEVLIPSVYYQYIISIYTTIRNFVPTIYTRLGYVRGKSPRLGLFRDQFTPRFKGVILIVLDDHGCMFKVECPPWGSKSDQLSEPTLAIRSIVITL